MTMPMVDARLATRIVVIAVCSSSDELLGEEVGQERGDAGVAEHDHELGQPGPAEVGVLGAG